MELASTLALFFFTPSLSVLTPRQGTIYRAPFLQSNHPKSHPPFLTRPRPSRPPTPSKLSVTPLLDCVIHCSLYDKPFLAAESRKFGAPPYMSPRYFFLLFRFFIFSFGLHLPLLEALAIFSAVRRPGREWSSSPPLWVPSSLPFPPSPSKLACPFAVFPIPLPACWRQRACARGWPNCLRLSLSFCLNPAPFFWTTSVTTTFGLTSGPSPSFFSLTSPSFFLFPPCQFITIPFINGVICLLCRSHNSHQSFFFCFLSLSSDC